MGPEATAAVFDTARRAFEVRTYPLVEPAAGSALLRMRRSGICGTDVHIAQGRLPMPIPRLIIGHELVGDIESLGSGAAHDGLGGALAPGDVAVACVAVPCGTCASCARGHTANCLSFGVTYVRDPDEPPHFHGGFAEFLHSPAANLVKVPAGVDLDAVAAFPCAGPTVLRALDLAGGLAGDELVVVQGTGPVGLFAVAWAAHAGCTVVAIGSGSTPARLERAKALGARLVLDYRATGEDERARVIRGLAGELGRGDGADVVLEATGAPAALREGLAVVGTLGRYVVPGQYSYSGPVSIDPHLITFKAIRIVGSGQYRLADLGAYVAFLAADPAIQRSFAACVTHRYAVADTAAAVADVAAGRAVKGVLAA